MMMMTKSFRRCAAIGKVVGVQVGVHKRRGPYAFV